MFYAVIGVLAIILDQWSKYYAAEHLVFGESAKTFIPGLLNLINVHNTGAAFSFLSDNPKAGLIFALFAIVFTVLVVVGIATKFLSGRFTCLCAVLVAAGGLSNAIDRVLYKYVQDMFQFAFWESFPVFNVADIFITVFCFLFILCIIFGGKKAPAGEAVEMPEPRKEKRLSRRAADEYEDEDEEVDEEVEEAPPARPAARRQSVPAEPAPAKVREERPAAARKPVKAASTEAPAAQTRKSRQNQYANEFEQYKARKEEVRRAAPQPERAPAPRFDSSDPFAEWEKANARINAQKAAEADAAVRSVLTAEEAGMVSAPAKHEAPERAVPQAQAPAAPAPKHTAPAPAPKAPASEEFSLDDILAEFK